LAPIEVVSTPRKASDRMVELNGTARTRCVLLVAHSDVAVEAVRSLQGKACTPADVAELPGLLSDLGNEFVVHAKTIERAYSEDGPSEHEPVFSLDGQPVALALLVRIVNLLDVAVAVEAEALPPPTSSNSSSCPDAAMGGDARRNMCSDRLVEIFNAGCGPRGFFRACLMLLAHEGATLACCSPWEQELCLHASLAVRLSLAWHTSNGPVAQHPCEALLAEGGLNALASLSRTKLKQLVADPSSGCFAELALALDALRLVAHFQGIRISQRNHQAIADFIPLVAHALDCAARVPQEELASGKPFPQSQEDAKLMSAGADAAAIAAVSLLAAAASVPAAVAAATMTQQQEPEQPAVEVAIAKALQKFVAGRPLSQRLAASLRSLTVKPRRARGWGFGGTSDAGAQFEKRLRTALAEADMPRECLRSAALQVDSMGRRSNVMPTGMLDHAVKTYHYTVQLACMYESVEAMVLAVHGSSVGADLVQEFRAARCDEDGDGSIVSTCMASVASTAGGSPARPAAARKNSLRGALKSLQHVVSRVAAPASSQPTDIQI